MVAAGTGEAAGVGPDRSEQPWDRLRTSLLGEGVLLATGVDGVYGRSAVYESIAEAVDALVLRAGVDQQATSVRFPPIMPWSTFERNGSVLGSCRKQ